MQSKTALIILFIIFILAMTGVIILFNFPIVNKNKADLSSTEGEISQDEIKRELSSEEKKQQMLDDLDKISDKTEKERLMNLTDQEKEELKQQMLDDLGKISE